MSIFLDPYNPKPEIQVLPEYTPYVQLDNNASTRDYGTGTPIVNQFNDGSSTPTGKFNWRKLVTAALSSLPFGGLLTEIFNQLAGKGITTTEMDSVDQWISQVFFPLLTRTMTQADALVKTGTLTMANISVLNNALSTLCIIKTHFATNDGSTNLTEDGLQYRYNLISASCDAIANAIATKISASGLSLALTPVQVNSAEIDFGIFNTSIGAGTYNCFNYQPSKTTQPIQTIKELPVSLPTNVTLPATTTTALQPAAENFVAKNKWLLLAGVFALGWAIAPKKKSKQ